MSSCRSGRPRVEDAAVLAVEAASRLHGLDPAVTAVAAAGLEVPGISVVDAALDAAELGATALHDPTEGGLAAGLHELAMAGAVRLRVDRARLLWFEPGLAVCRALSADPWATLALGFVRCWWPSTRPMPPPLRRSQPGVTRLPPSAWQR